MIIDINTIIEEKKMNLKQKIEKLNNSGIYPNLAVIVASDDEASKIYIKNKKKICDELGILQEEYSFISSTSEDEIISLIKNLNEDSTVHGILVQLPLFKHLNKFKILDSICYKKDVDAFSRNCSSDIYLGIENILSCTPKGIISILDNLNVAYEGANAVVIGRSNIVGKPIALALLNRNCTVTICHRKTKDLEKYTKEADILIVSAGSPHLVKANMVKEGATIIDVGINRENGNIIGDVDTKEVSKKADVTPVPGGVGKMTVISLIENLVYITEKETK